MFGIGSTELLVILVVALLVLGPKNLPRIAQTLGRAMGEFRKVSTEFQRTLNTEIAFEEEAEKHRKRQAEEKAAASADPSATAGESAPPETVTVQADVSGKSAAPASGDVKEKA